MKNLFMKEVQSEIDKYALRHEVFTESEITGLPRALQRYFRYCGFLGKTKMSYGKIYIDDVDFKTGINKPGIKMTSLQYNFVSDPTRIAYMNSKMLGIIPFEGRDKYQKGKGAMTGRILRKITLFDAKGTEFDISGLITFLAETILVPNCILQDYIKWEEIDSNRAKAVIEHKGTKVDGIFTFDEKGEFIKFETDMRYMDKGKGKLEKEKWTAELGDYVEKNGIKQPSRMKATWNLTTGDYVYFDGKITSIEFDTK